MDETEAADDIEELSASAAFDATFVASEAGGPPAQSPSARAPLGTARIGRYPILRKLGEGGMGVVFAAYDELLERRVAIKLLRPRRGGRGGARLLREAQGLARLSHPNVVQIYEIGEHEGAVFMAMEFVAGQTLGEWLDGAPRTRAEILRAFTLAGRGLAAAHAAGLIHRDFKPDNVMIGDDGQIKVMDFGLVRAAGSRGLEGPAEDTGAEDPSELEQTSEDALDDAPASLSSTPASLSSTPASLSSTPASRSSTPASRSSAPASRSSAPASRSSARASSSGEGSLGVSLTRTGAILGTPAYMAPEQHTGAATDARSDQFSFCVALWEALHGVRPFAGESVAALTFNVLRGKISEAPANAEVPSWLRRVVERGLALDPDQRWPSIDALLAALAKDPTRHRPALLAGLAITLAVGAGLVWQRAEQVRADRARAAAIETCEAEGRSIDEVWNAEVQARAAQAFSSTGLNFADSTWARTQTLLSDYTQTWAAARTQLCVGREVEASIDADTAARALACFDQSRASLASLVALLAEADDARVHQALSSAAGLPVLADCGDASKLAQAPALPDDPGARAAIEQLRARLAHAHALRTMGEVERARPPAEAVLAEAEALDWPPLIAATSFELGHILSDLSEYEAARKAHERSIYLALAAGDDLLALDAATALTFTVGVDLDHPEDGLRAARLAEALAERSDALISISVAHLRINVGAIHERMRELDEALAAFEDGLAIERELLPPTHPSLSIPLNNIATIHAQQGRLDEALAAFEKVRAIREASYPSGHPRLASIYENLGNIHSALGQRVEAEGFLSQCLAIREATLPPNHLDIASALRNRGSNRYKADKFEAAVDDYRRAYTITQAALPEGHTYVAEMAWRLASALIQAGDHEQALELIVPAVAIYDAAFAAGERRRGRELAGALESLGDALRGAGRLDEAIEAYERELEIHALVESPPLKIGLAQWYLALALWDAGPSRREEAIEVMHACYRAYLEHGEPSEAEETADWLRERGVFRGAG